jgi:hypothetical protein
MIRIKKWIPHVSGIHLPPFAPSASLRYFFQLLPSAYDIVPKAYPECLFFQVTNNTYAFRNIFSLDCSILLHLVAVIVRCTTGGNLVLWRVQILCMLGLSKFPLASNAIVWESFCCTSDFIASTPALADKGWEPEVCASVFEKGVVIVLSLIDFP